MVAKGKECLVDSLLFGVEERRGFSHRGFGRLSGLDKHARDDAERQHHGGNDADGLVIGRSVGSLRGVVCELVRARVGEEVAGALLQEGAGDEHDHARAEPLEEGRSVRDVHLLREQQDCREIHGGRDTEHDGDDSIVIGDGCWLASKVTVTGGVRLGRANLICAGSVVTKSTPDYAIMAGVPARQIGEIDPTTGEYVWYHDKEKKV